MITPIDDLNEAIREVERVLLSFNFGVPARVKFDRRWLAFKQSRGEWCLAVIDEFEHEVRLLNCSRDTRIAAIQHLEVLFAELQQRSAECDQSVKAAVGIARAFCSNVKPL